VHDVNPVFEEGMVTGCDFTVTLYNRTAINFRSFSINMLWNDAIEENFHFNKYMETFITPEVMAAQRGLLEKEAPVQPVKVAINVNAFGADKQISIRSHVDTEKCYLLLQPAEYSVAPCDIARNVDNINTKGLENNECTALFQLVNTSNPEYFGQFKNISATEIAAQNQSIQENELSDIDTVISKIVENLGTSDKTLTDIN
jgi:predicted house-cleaning noncanonical NTP pyrophosphatase (MazG superfamily)